jgi:hypothetical protein
LWLTPVILATQEAEIRRITASVGKYFAKPYPSKKKPHHKKGVVEWLKV